jgi:hypothetical protein
MKLFVTNQLHYNRKLLKSTYTLKLLWQIYSYCVWRLHNWNTFEINIWKCSSYRVFSLIGGDNWGTRGKPPTYYKTLTNFTRRNFLWFRIVPARIGKLLVNLLLLSSEQFRVDTLCTDGNMLITRLWRRPGRIFLCSLLSPTLN